MWPVNKKASAGPAQPSKKMPSAQAKEKADQTLCACGCGEKHNNTRLFVVGHPQTSSQKRLWITGKDSCQKKLLVNVKGELLKEGSFY
jgi:hypothetical protein